MEKEQQINEIKKIIENHESNLFRAITSGLDVDYDIVSDSRQELWSELDRIIQ